MDCRDMPLIARYFASIVVPAVFLYAAQIPPPQVPANLKPPGSPGVLLKAHADGIQIYACRALAGSPAGFEWVLEKPQADLFGQDGKTIGRHYEGPTWEALDGSRVTGHVEQQANAPHSGAVPWLLVKATRTYGSGVFAHVTYIQRVNTSGGAVPSEGCDREHVGKEVTSPYQADYYFYGPQR